MSFRAAQALGPLHRHCWGCWDSAEAAGLQAAGGRGESIRS